MFLNQQDDLILLLINTIMRDLQSKNEAEINMALVTGGNRISGSPNIVKLLYTFLVLNDDWSVC